MTWIVGAPTMFGYSFGISDVRVTLGDGSEVDCLQKVHRIGRHIAAGFAGSVRIGFAMIDELRRLSDFDDPRIACDPDAVLKQWPVGAREVFSRFEPEEQADHCHLMLLMVHPLAHSGDPSCPQSSVCIFRSPEFKPELVTTNMLGTIGSGIAYEPCRQTIDSFEADFKRREIYMQGEVGTQGGMASMIGSMLTGILKNVQPRGVSAHLHYCWVYRGQTIIKTNNHAQKGRWTIEGLGSGINNPENHTDKSAEFAAMQEGSLHFSMPRLAETWEELISFLNLRGADAHGSTA
jgi:hypothetical protein